MERSGLARWLLIGLAVLLLLNFLPKWFGNGGEAKLQPLKAEYTNLPPTRSSEETCTLEGASFRAEFGSHGAALEHAWLLSKKYEKDHKAIDLSTTAEQEFNRPLRFSWRNAATGPSDSPLWQVDYDLLDFQLVAHDSKSFCKYSYADEKVELTQTLRLTGRPYEIEVASTITNKAAKALRHSLTVQTSAWRLDKEVEGKMFRVSPYVTHAECARKGGDTVRLLPKDFEPDDFKDAAFQSNALNLGDWYQVGGDVQFAAVSNAYFSQALVPVSAPHGGPVCQLLIEERWHHKKFSSKSADPNAGGMYRARLAYDAVELAPGKSATYEVLSYIGPKERNVLAAAGGGKTGLGELIDLGFFSVIAKVLVSFLLKLYQIIPSWGVAIIILTLTARVLLFPLAIPSIRSMIKMRELKPEIEKLNEKYKDDPQGKGLAQMELWRKHNVNPLKGCLPQLASMPVWFALYTTLQTAVELYNIPFLWFPDLSEPDPFYILPFVIGSTYFLQQKLMPMQADPAQQKMMMYFMPGMFTVFMLFLPSGLGVYMFTNSVLGIVQQQIVEYHARRSGGGGNGATKKSNDVSATSGKSKASSGASAKGGKNSAGSAYRQLAEGQPALGKGKA